jgi:putative transposase
VARKKKGSRRRKKAVRLLVKAHEQVANQRRDTAHQVSRRDWIAFEDLTSSSP